MTVCMLVLMMAAPEPSEAVVSYSAEGTVRVVRGGGTAADVLLVTADGTVTLRGDGADELGRLSSIKVGVYGPREADVLRVTGYDILDVGGGAKPEVGTLEHEGERWLLRDRAGQAYTLDLTRRSRARLANLVGAKLWVLGSSSEAGTLRVLRYGVLREPPKAPAP